MEWSYVLELLPTQYQVSVTTRNISIFSKEFV